MTRVMTSGRLPGSRLAIAALLSVLVSFVAQGAVFAENGQIRLALRPVGQAGTFFDLTMIPGEARSLAVDIANDGHAALAARTYAADVYTIINGGFGARLRDEAQTGMTRWLAYPADVLQLAPGGRVRRTFTVAVPVDAGPGEYITSLVLENDEPFQGNGAVGLNQVVRQAVAVVVTVPGPRSPGLAIGKATHKVVGDMSVVSVAVENTGNVRLKPIVKFALLDSMGIQISRATVPMDTFYAHTQTFIEVPLSALLLPGTYTVSLALEDAAQGVRADDVAIPLMVEAPPGTPAPAGVVPGLTKVIQTAHPGPLAPLGIVLVAGLLSAAALAMRLRVLRSHGGARTSER